MNPTDTQDAELVRVEAAALVALLDWFDLPKRESPELAVSHAAQRLRLQLESTR